MSLQGLSDWLYASPLSQTIQSTEWIIPTVQSIHILAISVLFGSAMMMNLRMIGVIAGADARQDLFLRYMPWLWAALAVLVLTGMLMVVGEPERVLGNTVFWAKMGLVALAVCLCAILRKEAGKAIVPARRWVRIVAGVALLIWAVIIFCGRWIAYAI